MRMIYLLSNQHLHVRWREKDYVVYEKDVASARKGDGEQDK